MAKGHKSGKKSARHRQLDWGRRVLAGLVVLTLIVGGLAWWRVSRAIAGADDMPRFRVDINTGPTLAGNVGSDELREFTAIGDAVNVAARLQTLAEPGQVVLGATTERPSAPPRPSSRSAS